MSKTYDFVNYKTPSKYKKDTTPKTTPDKYKVSDNKFLNFVGRSYGTVQEGIDNVLQGMFSVPEGIVDFGANIISSIAGATGNTKAEEKINKFIEKQWADDAALFYRKYGIKPQVGGGSEIVSNIIKEPIVNEVNGTRISDFSYAQDLGETGHNFVEGIEQSIGQMLATIAVGQGTGEIAGALGAGTKAVGTISNAAGLTSTGLSAAGSGSEQALSEGATSGQALGYGALSGLAEAGVEAISGKIGGKIIPGLGEATKKTFGTVLKDAFGEGLEEVITEVLDSFIKPLTYTDEYTAPQAEEIFTAFASGALVGGLFGAASPTVQSDAQQISNGINANLETLNTLTEQYKNGQIDEKTFNKRKEKLLKDNARWSKQIDKLLKDAKKQGVDIKQDLIDAGISEDGKTLQQNDGGVDVTIDPLTNERTANYTVNLNTDENELGGIQNGKESNIEFRGQPISDDQRIGSTQTYATKDTTNQKGEVITNEILERNSKEEIVENRKVNVVDSEFMANNWSNTVDFINRSGLDVKVFSNTLFTDDLKYEVQAFINGKTIYINSAYASDSRHAMHEILHTKINNETREKVIAELKRLGYYENVYKAYAEAYSDLSSIDIDEEIAIDAMAQLDAFEGLEEFKEIRDKLLQNKTTESKTKDKRNSIIFQRLNDLKRRNLTIDSVYTLDEYIVFKKDLQNKTYVELYSIPNDGQYDDLIDSIEEAIRNEEINRGPNIVNRVTEIIKSRQRMHSSDNVDAQQIGKSPNNDDGISSKQRESNSRPNNGKSDNYRKDKRSVNLENVKKGERSDEFRRIQEESRKLSSSISQQERVDSFDDSLYKRIRGILSREIRSFRGSNFDTSRLVVNNDNFKVFSNIDGTLFHDCFEVAKTYLQNGELVDLHDNYDNCNCYLSSDGLSGFAITENGDLISVFNLSKEKGWLKAVSSIVTKKAKTLDCYVSPHQNLKGMYEAKFGFKTASTMDYNMEYDHDDIAKNHNMPQVAFMVNTTEDVETRHFNKYQYDEAQAYQQSFVKKTKDKRSVKPSVDYAGKSFATELETKLSSIFRGQDIKVEYSKPNNVTRISTEIMSSQEHILTTNTANALAEHMWNYTKVTMDGETFTMSDLYEDIKYLKKDLMKTKVRFRSVTDVADFYKERYAEALKQYKELKEFTTLTRQIEKQAQKMFDKAANANKHIGTYTTAKVKAFQEIIGKLKTLRKGKSTRSYFASFANLIAPQTSINMGVNSDVNPELTPLGTIYDENMHQFFTELGEGNPNSQLTVEELKQLKSYLKGLSQQFDRITKNQVVTRTGESVDITKKITNYVEIAQVNPAVKNDKITNYFDFISDSEAVFSYLDNHNVYGTGVFTDIYNDLIACHNVECSTQLEFNDIIDEIMDRKTRKRYSKTLKTAHSVNVGKQVVKMSKDSIISLYMSLKDEAGYKHVKTGSFYYEGKRGEYDRVTYETLDMATLESSLESLLTEQDKQYIKAIEAVLKKSKQIKTNIDVKRLGYSNVIDNYYFPLIVKDGDGKSNLGNAAIKFRDIRQVSRTSFNNSRTRSFDSLEIIGVTELIQNYMAGMAKYNAYGIEMDYINALFDTRFKDENGKNVHLKHTLEGKEMKNRVFKWFNDYLLDIQGANDVQQKNWLDRAIQFTRRGLVTSSLGFNVASPFKQLPAYLLGYTELSGTSLTKAFGKSIFVEKTKAQVYKYSPYLRMRFESGEVSRGHFLGADAGQKVVTKAITDIQDVSMLPIEFVDELTILKTFEACKFEVESKHKGDTEFKYGTEKNMQEASKLCEKLVREFQPNYTSVDKSAIQRSQSETIKSLAMFTLQPTKMFSRLRQYGGEILSLRTAIKETKANGKSVDVLKTRLNSANKKFTKAFTAIAMQGILYTMIGRLIKTIMGKREWEDFFNDPEDPLVLEFVTDTYIGMFPIIKDLYGVLFNGYDIAIIDIDNVNTFLSTVRNIGTDLVSGKEVDWNNQLRKLSFSMSGVLGLPTKNVYDIIYGVTNWFSPETAYKCKNLFYQDSAGNATEAFKNALTKGNTKQAITILETSFVNNKTGVAPNEKVLEEITRLYSEGYQTIQPKNVSDNIEIDGETYQLKATQKNKFKETYSKANEVMLKIISSSAYKKLSDDAKASLVKRVYSTYYDNAKSKVLSTYQTSDKLSILANTSLDLSKIMTILSAVSEIKATKTKTRKELVQAYIEKQSLTRNEKYLIFALSGYSIGEENEKALKSYLKVKGLSSKEMDVLFPSKE